MMYNTTMNVATFDTYRFIKRLKEAGISETHAEAEADALSEALKFNLGTLATKADINEVKADIEGLRTELKGDISEVKTDVATLAGQMQIMIWVMGVMAAGMFGMIWVLLSIAEKIH